MRTSIKLLYLSLLLTTTVCIAADNNKDKIEFTDPAKSIIVNRSQPVFHIVLKSNPTTGYSWFLKEYDINVIKPVNHIYYPPNNKLVGAPGYEDWIFKVKVDGFKTPRVTDVSLVYMRPWEGQDTKPTNFKVILHNDN